MVVRARWAACVGVVGVLQLSGYHEGRDYPTQAHMGGRQQNMVTASGTWDGHFEQKEFIYECLHHASTKETRHTFKANGKNDVP